MPWPVRCRREACQARQGLARRPEEYTRKRKCKRCGKGALRVDEWRLKHERKKRPCDCLGWSFPHRKGCKYCDHDPNLTPEMLEQREAYA